MLLMWKIMKKQNVKVESKWRKNEYDINVIKLSQNYFVI